MPQPGHSLGDANIVGLEGVESDTKSDGSNAESPHGEVAKEGHSLLREVVDDGCPEHVSRRFILVGLDLYILEANVRVYDQESAENRVSKWV